ncbi:DUF4388 domain-containing protein [Dermatobacter hominis]|uniref:DUF4388 domain-containing protein n=1 Tax=Dermatobacter hominis TaxID=2884263 RepID=UPI001D0F4B7D|nr:DUF4388 domain-containing protein [Dermatobacter hominis]UDY36182.1 DUF4388 domain-containing protein [Dermatobacter hominis]
MALQGTIDAFPVVDVLQLLAGAHKTGRLIVEGDRSTAQLFVVDGTVTAGGVQGLDLTDVADVVVELLRYQEGSFLFEPGSTAPEPGDPQDLGDVVEAAHERLQAWSAVEAVVPSLAHRLALVPELGEDGIELSPTDWPVVVAAGAQDRVGDLVTALGLSDLAGCALIADLVERGVVLVEAPRAELVPLEAPPVAVEEVVEDHEVLDAELVDVEEEPGAGFELVDVADDDDAAETAYEVVLLDDDVDDGSFPEHFPIDDLLGAGEDEDPWVQLETAGREERLAAAQFSDDPDGAGLGSFADGFSSGAFSSEGFSSGDTGSVDAGAGHEVVAGAADPGPGPAVDGDHDAAASWDDQEVGGFNDLGAFTDPVEPAGANGATGTGALAATFVGDGAFTDAPARTPLAVQEPVVADRAADTAADEVLRQMSKLSPKAAEAIAAALGSAADDGDAGPDGDQDGGGAGR